MAKTLHLHIGHFKTGTTALQVFLARNPRLLERHDLEYAAPFIHNAKHSGLAFPIYHAAGVTTLMHGYKANDTPEERWHALFDAVRKSQRSGVIVSSEEFMRLGGIPAACDKLPRLAALAPDIRVRVIAYLRAPDAHLRSWYNQLVKMRVKVPDFNTAVRDVIEPVHTDYALALRPWIETFGTDNVIVRPYADSFRSGTGLYADFLSLFGVTLPDAGKLSLPDGDPNPRLDERTLEIVRLLQNAGAAPKLVKQLQQRAMAHFEVEGIPEIAFDEVRARIGDGLRELVALPHNGVDIDAFAAQLPRPEDPERIEQARMTGFLLSEINLLRARFNKAEPEINARLDALEAATTHGSKDST